MCSCLLCSWNRGCAARNRSAARRDSFAAVQRNSLSLLLIDLPFPRN